MFKQVMSSLGDSVRSTGRSFGRSTTHSELASDKLTSIISAGLTGIGSRSPILSDIVSTINDKFLASVAIEKERNAQYKDFVGSETGKVAGKEATKSEPQLSQKKIDSQMMGVLSKITHLIDRSGIEEAKKSDLYKKYETYYTEFKKTIDEAAKKQSDPKPTQQSYGPRETGGTDDLLVDIEANTKNTAEALLKGAGTTPAHKEPVTIKGAAQHIGGTFLNKVFNDDMISRMANATTAPFTKFGGTGTGNLGTKGSYIAHDTSLQAKVKAEGLNEETTLEAAKQKEKSDDELLHSNEGILANTDKILEHLEKEKAAKDKKEKEEKEKSKDPADREKPGILDKMLDDFVSGKNSETTKEVEAAQSKRDSTELAVDKQTLETLKKIEEKTGKGIAGTEGKTLIEKIIGGLTETLGLGSLGKILPKIVSAGGWALASGAMLGAGAAIDSGLGAMGVGGNKIDEAKDEENWKKSSTWEKIQSAPARAIENVADKIFLDKMANQARSERIASESKYMESKELTKDSPWRISKDSNYFDERVARKKKEANKSEESAKVEEAAKVEEPKVLFRRARMRSESIGRNRIIGFEHGYQLNGIKSDVEDAEKAYEDFDKYTNERNDVEAATAAEKFTTLANKINSPEYQAKVEEISAKQNATKATTAVAKEKSNIAIKETSNIATKETSRDISDKKAAIESQKKTPGSEVERLTAVKDTQTAAQTAKAAQPIVINNTSAAAPAPAQPPVISITPSIRNQDSTFERTQMKDFWARTF
jgi:hypothetical protein